MNYLLENYSFGLKRPIAFVKLKKIYFKVKSTLPFTGVTFINNCENK